MKPLRARVTYAWGGWWYDLRRGPETAEYTCPVKFASASIAADIARRELAIRREPDRVKRALMRAGVLPIPTRADLALAN